MKMPVFAAAVSIISLSWLGMSFATPSEEGLNPQIEELLSEGSVSAEHPDSHRLGAVATEKVALPKREESGDSSQAGAVLAFLVE
jgi:hypothetical protein